MARGDHRLLAGRGTDVAPGRAPGLLQGLRVVLLFVKPGCAVRLSQLMLPGVLCTLVGRNPALPDARLPASVRPQTHKRVIPFLFVRGDGVVLVSPPLRS